MAANTPISLDGKDDDIPMFGGDDTPAKAAAPAPPPASRPVPTPAPTPSRPPAASSAPRPAAPPAQRAPINFPKPGSMASKPQPINPPPSTPKPPMPQPTDTLVEAAITACAAYIKNDDLRKKFSAIAGLYFRDLRDEIETRSKLTTSAESGGMGLSAADADSVMAIIRPRALEYRKNMTNDSEQEKKRYVEKTVEEARDASAKTEKRDQAVLDKRYGDLMKSANKDVPAPAPTPVAKVIPVATPSAPPKPAASKFASPIDDIMPGAHKEEFVPKNLPIAAEPPKPAPAAPPEKKIVADVATERRLIGPVEELRTMTLADFRRLSRDPKEATIKVKDKLELLVDQGYDVKLKGIAAWQQSEPSRTYYSVIVDALGGMSIENALEKRRAKGGEAISLDEFDAIMSLNRSLRYG